MPTIKSKVDNQQRGNWISSGRDKCIDVERYGTRWGVEKLSMNGMGTKIVWSFCLISSILTHVSDGFNIHVYHYTPSIWSVIMSGILGSSGRMWMWEKVSISVGRLIFGWLNWEKCEMCVWRYVVCMKGWWFRCSVVMWIVERCLISFDIVGNWCVWFVCVWFD